MSNMEQENLPAVPEEKKDLIHSAKDFVNNIFQPLKGKDLNQAVEEFTSEMTLVIEGLSEDQERTAQQVDQLSARQTILEESLLSRLEETELALSDAQKEMKALQKKLEKAEKAAADKKISKVSGFTGMLRQATWLVGIAVGGWIIVTLIKALL
ncbi:MAG: hypothetical protein IKJ51_00990 [Clostridia bacterium]|nr:hypothetical protein [Clostridia bacterium]